MRARDVSTANKEPSKFISHGGLHLSDVERVAYSEPGYLMVRFEREPDGYHWRAVYKLNEGQFP